MLYTRNAFYFRKYYKEEVARESGWLDLNYVGSLHPDRNRKETGFSKLIYGNREDIGKLLSTIALNVAADDQAIYELIQNADDCKSSFFSVNYNEKYLLCINNGNYFSNDDMAAIINVAGNFKEGEDIGTFGIGFKILHRLVGQDDGRDAIINDYAGPVIFSWNKFSQLEKFLNGEELKVGSNEEKDKENPWLIKILYTCFPCHLNEKLKLKDYDSHGTKFDQKELQEMRDFLKDSLNEVNLHETNYLKNGSIFFLKLGDGKSKFLDDGIEKIKSGLAYSFKFLNSLKKIYINSDEIRKHSVDDFSGTFIVGSPEFKIIKPKNNKRDIKFTLAYYREYQKAEHLRNESVPNLYTFFSMDEERNGFNFLLHCNAFDMNNDRRKLQANSQINETLLPLIANEIIRHLNNQKIEDRALYLALYSNLLLSKEPKNKPHLNNYFFNYLKAYLHHNIPTESGYSNDSNSVKIKSTFLDISPSEFGCNEIQWFYWSSKQDDLIIGEALNSEKLSLEKWNILKLIEYAVEQDNQEFVNKWVSTVQPKTYFLFLKELEKHINKISLSALSKIKLFKFSDGNFYSLDEIFSSEDLILNYDKTSEIRFELQSIGFVTSFINIVDYPNTKDLIQNKFNDYNLYLKIKEKAKNNNFKKEQKHKLFFALADFEKVGAESLKDIELFKDSKGTIQPLRKLLKGDIDVPNWLFNYKIHKAEYISDLDKYLVKDSEIYESIILPNWLEVIKTVRNIVEFYEKVKFYYDQNESNVQLKNQPFVYLNPDDGFIEAKHVFYNSKFAKLSNYKMFQNAVLVIIQSQTPNKTVLGFLNSLPFKVDNSDFFDHIINPTLELTLQEVQMLLDFCKANNESFFEKCIIERQDKLYSIYLRPASVYQIRPSKKDLKDFINLNLHDRFKILPYELDEYKDEKGIISGEDLYNLILDNVQIDEFKEQLVDIISYDFPKRKFLLNLSELRFIAGDEINKESYELKIINLACNTLRIDDFNEFRSKIVIKTADEELKLENIPPFIDKIKIADFELSLSKILPNTYHNSDHLSKIIGKLVEHGINKDNINNLFGINNEPKLSDIFNLFLEETTILENGEQLAFVLLYNKFCEVIDLKSFKLLCKGGGEYDLTYNFYTKHHNFLVNDATLEDKYLDFNNVIKELPFKISESNQILEEPYFENEKFHCPDLLKDEITEEGKISLITFLFNQWEKGNKKTVIKNIDWKYIDEVETENFLGFNPSLSVFPSEYALSNEELPEYLQEWINNDAIKVNFLSDIGVLVEGTTLVSIRKHFLGQELFDKNKIAQESRFTKDETILFNTFNWLKTRKLQIAGENELSVFEELVRVINSSREKGRELIIQDYYDYDLLESESTEWDASYYMTWKDALEGKFKIYLYQGMLPKVIRLDEVDDYIFYRYNKGNVVINDDNSIYVNITSDIKKSLSLLIAEENDFTTEDLLLLYQTREISQTENDEFEELKNEVERLRQLIANLQAVSGRDSTDVTTRDDEYLIQIKEVSEAYLFQVLKELYPNDKVKWLNFNENEKAFCESWQNHDFEVINHEGEVLHYIDCKGTPRQKRTFYLTSNEWEFFLNCIQENKNYQIFRIFDVEGSANYLQIDNLWEWIEVGKVVPYLTATETIKGGRVFLTLMN